MKKMPESWRSTRGCHEAGTRGATSRTVSPAKRDSRFCLVSSATTFPALSIAMRRAKRLGFLEVVRRQDDRVAVAIQLADERPEALPELDVDTRGRLVEHDHRRLVDERLADQHAALHAARERAHVGVRLRHEVEMVEDLVDPAAVVANAEVAGLDLRGFRAP